MPSVPTRKRFIANFLVVVCRSFFKILPELDSKNSRKLQFDIKFAVLKIYAWRIGLPVRTIALFRTAKEQNERYKQGRDPEYPGPIVTNCDGYDIKSRHQIWEAGDLLIFKIVDGVLVDEWSRHAYKPLGDFWIRLGGTWGGQYEGLRDCGHFQL